MHAVVYMASSLEVTSYTRFSSCSRRIKNCLAWRGPSSEECTQLRQTNWKERPDSVEQESCYLETTLGQWLRRIVVVECTSTRTSWCSHGWEQGQRKILNTSECSYSSMPKANMRRVERWNSVCSRGTNCSTCPDTNGTESKSFFRGGKIGRNTPTFTSLGAWNEKVFHFVRLVLANKWINAPMPSWRGLGNRVKWES